MKTIPLTRGYMAKVDDADYLWLGQLKWHVSVKRKPYAVTWMGRKRVAMHRLLCEGRVVDHINGDSLDNRRENLRPSNIALNNANTRGRQRGPVPRVTWELRLF